MNNFRAFLLVSTAAVVVSGCSTLDSSSTFDNVAQSVEERQNFVQVVAKDIVPESKPVFGPDVIKSSLYYVGNFARDPKVDVDSSYVKLEVMTFKNYDQYDTVSIFGNKLDLKNYRPQSETCTEHCVVTQWVQFPFDSSVLEQVHDQKVEFTVSSSSNKSAVKFAVPKAYFDAVKQEAEYAMGQKPQATTVKPENLPLKLNGSKSQDMVQYWYGEGSVDEKKQFADWAFTQRTTVTNMIQTESKSVEMMAYWYDKANKDQKSEILAWLIRQE